MSGVYTVEQIFISLRDRGEPEGWAETLCRGIAEASRSELTAFYRIPGGKRAPRWAYFSTKTGYVPVPDRLPLEREDLRIAVETGLTVVQNSTDGPFPGLLLSGEMRSGIVVCAGDAKLVSGLLIANHRTPFFYSGEMIRLFERLSTLLGGMRGGSDG